MGKTETMNSAERKDQEINDETPTKSCPWCGEIPNITELGWGGMSIRCNNRACRMRPETTWCDSVEEALTMWNARHI